MRIVKVYRVDYVKKTKVPIGRVVERREKYRGGNLLGLLRLARKFYGTGPKDTIHIAVDSREASAAGRGPRAMEEREPIERRNLATR
jgi:hypothetical protein